MNFHSVIIVTSKAHTRRVRTIWRKLVGSEPRMMVHYADDDTLRRRALVAPHPGRAGRDARDSGPAQRLGRLPVAPERELVMPVRQRKPNEIAQQVVPLLLLGIGLVTTNNSVDVHRRRIHDPGRRGESAANDARACSFPAPASTSTLRSMTSFFISGCAGREEISTIFGFHPFFFFWRGFFCWAAPAAICTGHVWRHRRHLAGSPVAFRLSFWPSGDLVFVFVFSGRRFDALLFQVSGRPDHWPLGGILSLLRLFDLDQLFRLGHSRVPRDRSGSSLAIERTCGDSQSSPGNRGAVMRVFPSSLFRVPR